MTTRPRFDRLGLDTGKKARLHRILHQHGLRNGTALFLPYDQGLEHGPRDFFANPVAGDPAYIIRLAIEGGFNAIAIQIGLAEKFYWDYAGEVPLILKLNGKTDIPSDAQALSPVHGSVADAVRLGADAVGYTMYVGTPVQDQDFAQFRVVREDAQRYGMPLIVWAYPRGSGVPAAYDIEITGQQAVEAVVRSANRTLVLISGGEKAGDEAMLDKARQSMEAGATGLIFGRNVWQRERDSSLRFVERLREVLAKYPSA